MTLPGITHVFGPWSPMRFIPVPTWHEGPLPPAFWITTARICRGNHDPLCSETQSQTFGPLVLQESTAADVWQCPNCLRHQPPADPGALSQAPVCLFCSDASTVQHTGDSRDTAAAVTALAALHAATGTLRQVTDQDGSVRPVDLLEGATEALRQLLDYGALAVKQDPARAQYAGNRVLVQVAHQITGNARRHFPGPREPLPVRENDDE